MNTSNLLSLSTPDTVAARGTCLVGSLDALADVLASTSDEDREIGGMLVRMDVVLALRSVDAAFAEYDECLCGFPVRSLCPVCPKRRR